MPTRAVSPLARASLGAFVLLECWAACALLGALAFTWAGPRSREPLAEAEAVFTGIRWLGGLGLYLGVQIALVRVLRHVGQTEAARAWRARCVGFHFVVLQVCALGALLGAIVFPIAGALGGAYKTRDELIVLGTRTGGFFFMVWAPGVALVRMFIRAAARKRLHPPAP